MRWGRTRVRSPPSPSLPFLLQSLADACAAVLLLKCWEYSPENKVGTITPHTAFVDPRYYGKEGVELRESIEVRVLVFHEPEE